jgi:hypothetical protein
VIAQKLMGVAIIAVAVAILALVSVFDPPTLVQIGTAFVGSIVCLVGIVVVFSEYPIEIKEVLGKTSPKVH